MPYYNPYYSAVGGGGGGWNYGQPIPVAGGAGFAGAPALAGGPNGLAANAVDPDAIDAGGVDPNALDPNAVASNPSPEGNPDIDSAVERFRAGDYAGALPLVDGAIQARPTDAAAHELRALILFAMEDYTPAAATIHSVLAVGPGWDWTTLSSLYPDIQTYTTQLQALEAFVNSHPKQADARFLLAYHYMTEGHTDEASGQLQKVVNLMPRDKLAADLLRMVQGGNGAPPPDAVPPAPVPGPDVKPVDPALLAGSWQASRDDGSKFSLNLAGDKSFTWKFSQQKQQPQTISGTYTVDNGLLIMQGKTGGAMVGQLSAAGGDRFTFKPLGAPPDDPGLTFMR
jgi:tetratricopeptide (TPR) repeat protein